MDKPKNVAAVVGGGTLLGREVRDLLAGTSILTRLIGADPEESGLLTEEGGEPVVMTELDEDNLAGARVVFLAGSAAAAHKTLGILPRLSTPPAVIDLTYALEDRPGAYLRAPMAEPGNYQTPAVTEHVIAHPAAILLASFLTRLHQAACVKRVVAQVFEPASERGQRGLDELQKQTVNLLTFQPLPKDVYDEQVGFNLLARYGAEAPESMENIELRIERHLATLLSLHGRAELPSLRLVQVPIFHGHTVSVWVEFDQHPGIKALESALSTPQIDVRGADLEPPNIVGMAGQDGIAVSITADRNNPHASWFWVVADNIRIMAENAVAVGRSLMGHVGTARPQ